MFKLLLQPAWPFYMIHAKKQKKKQTKLGSQLCQSAKLHIFSPFLKCINCKMLCARSKLKPHEAKYQTLCSKELRKLWRHNLNLKKQDYKKSHRAVFSSSPWKCAALYYGNAVAPLQLGLQSTSIIKPYFSPL